MKPWILPAVMTAIAGVLVLGVIHPDSAREVVAIPKAWIEARTATALKTRTRAEWGDITRRSADGDADAMYRLGTKMRVWSNEEWTGVKTDPARGEDLIRRAAEAGHLEAQLMVWQIDGRNPAALISMADEIRAEEKDVAELGLLSDWLRWTALRACDAELRDGAIRLHRSFKADETGGATSPDARSRYRSFMDTFEQRCLPE